MSENNAIKLEKRSRRVKQLMRRNFLEVVLIGEIFNEVRESFVKRGDGFDEWLMGEFQLTSRTARRWMVCARKFEGYEIKQLEKNLDPTVLAILLCDKCSHAVVQSALARHAKGEEISVQLMQGLVTAERGALKS